MASELFKHPLLMCLYPNGIMALIFYTRAGFVYQKLRLLMLPGRHDTSGCLSTLTPFALKVSQKLRLICGKN